MNIEYTIDFLDYWHLSSGLSAGAKLDSSVIKDSKKLPYMPGKTIKGLAREMAELFKDSEGNIDCKFVNICFGGSSDDKDNCYSEEYKQTEGICYFSNATIKDDISKEIIEHCMQDSLYDVITSTSIDEKTKVAVDNSLREIEVVVPITLQGYVDNVPSEYANRVISSLEMIKRVGLNRNRGLGRCRIVAKEAK